jgi:hypothetical protein
MHYRSSFNRRNRTHFGVLFGTVGVVAILLGLFAYGIWWFRFAPKDEPEAEAKDTIADVMTPSPVSSAIIAATSSSAGEARLSGPDGSGKAEREMDDGQLVFTIKATLPEIDREKFYYEGWLLRQVPYDFISVGDLVTNDDGEWVLEWGGAEGKYDAYTQVVVTLEAMDGNPDPSGHVLEGEF